MITCCALGRNELIHNVISSITARESLIYYTFYRSPMNTKVFLLAIAIVAAAATFAITAIASIDVFSAVGPTEAFAQNMTNMTGGNMTNMTG